MPGLVAASVVILVNDLLFIHSIRLKYTQLDIIHAHCIHVPMLQHDCS